MEFLTLDVAIAWGTYVVVSRDGSKEIGHFMNTFIRRNGKWLTAAEQNSSSE